jgi:exonuclease SbcC
MENNYKQVMQQLDAARKTITEKTPLIETTLRDYASKTNEELKTESQWIDDERVVCDQKIGGYNQQIDNNNKQKESLQKIGEDLENKKNEAKIWALLNELVGSSDGAKYKKFVQSLTFRYVVGYANEQLKKMTDRYLLIQKNDSQLDLNIVDKYQAGSERSIANISGGEKFLVCLALALGLSAMSSQKVRVDSLFLDEGFGSLDDESLEIALNVLYDLQQDGKQIGIISHVQFIKDNITNQICVERVSEGISKISFKR